MTKVALVDSVLDPSKPGRSGLSDLVWDMASYMIDYGCEVHVIGSYSTSVVPDLRVTLHNFLTPPIGYRNVIGHAWMIKRALSVIHNISPDIVHSPEYFSTAIMAVLGVQAPMVLTVPGNIFQRLSVPGGSGYEWYYAQILKWAAKTSARKCSSVIAISTEMKRWWEWSGSASEKTPVIPLGADRKRFYFVADSKKKLGLDSRVLVLYVGRFSREKGLLDLMTAISRLSTGERKNIQVVLIGKGTLQDELQRRLQNDDLSDVVRIIPWIDQDELLLWYSSADALVLPSYTEGFSRTIVESMMCGTPILGSRISGTEDHVHDGITGYLFDSGDVEKLKSLLAGLCEQPDLFRGLRSSTEEYARENFSWDRIASKIVEEVYVPIIERRGQKSVSGQNVIKGAKRHGA